MKNAKANSQAFDVEGRYRTGDIGHLDADGNVFVVDRVKEIIKYKTLQVIHKIDFP